MRALPPQSVFVASIFVSILRMPTESRSKTGLDALQSPTTVWSPVRASMVSMPKAPADRNSPMIAMRERSRPVIWRIGSAPICFSAMQKPREDAFREADCISVTLMPWTRSLMSFAVSSSSVKSQPLGGAISAVTPNLPAAKACCNLLIS